MDPQGPVARVGRVERFADLSAAVLRALPRAGSTRIVAVDGPAGSGKTTFAQRLASRLQAPVLHMDDLYPGWDGLAAAVPALVEQVLVPVARGHSASYRRWDWERDEYADRHHLAVVPVLVVEGVGSGARAAAEWLSLLVWIEAPADVRMTRGLDRDGETFRPHWERWAAQERRLFTAERTRDRADIRVDGAPSVPHDPASEFVTVP